MKILEQGIELRFDIHFRNKDLFHNAFHCNLKKLSIILNKKVYFFLILIRIFSYQLGSCNGNSDPKLNTLHHSCTARPNTGYFHNLIQRNPENSRI